MKEQQISAVHIPMTHLSKHRVFSPSSDGTTRTARIREALNKLGRTIGRASVFCHDLMGGMKPSMGMLSTMNRLLCSPCPYPF